MYSSYPVPVIDLVKRAPASAKTATRPGSKFKAATSLVSRPSGSRAAPRTEPSEGTTTRPQPSGSKTTGRGFVGKIKREQLREIAEKKMVDLNCDKIESAVAMIEGSARSMGLEVVG